MGRIHVPAMFCAQPHFTWRPVRRPHCQHQEVSADEIIQNIFETFFSPDEPRQRCAATCQRSACDVRKKPWVHVLIVRGYDPDDIEVKVQDNKVLVHARHEVRDGENMDSYETSRVVQIPDDVDLKKMCSFLKDKNTLIIRAPRIEDGRKDETEEEKKEMKTEETKLQPTEPEVIKTEVNPDLPKDAQTTTTISDGEFVLLENTENSKGMIEVDTPRSPTSSLLSGEVTLETENTSIERDVEEQAQKDEETDVIGRSSLATRQLNSLSVLEDSTQIVEEEDGRKEFRVKINLDDFTDEDLSIRSDDDTLYVDGVKAWDEHGMKGRREIHRQFTVPGVGQMGAAKALRDDSGILTVTIPLESETKKVEKQIPIQHC